MVARFEQATPEVEETVGQPAAEVQRSPKVPDGMSGGCTVESGDELPATLAGT
jgi:hypothetical protein